MEWGDTGRRQWTNWTSGFGGVTGATAPAGDVGRVYYTTFDESPDLSHSQADPARVVNHWNTWPEYQNLAAEVLGTVGRNSWLSRLMWLQINVAMDQAHEDSDHAEPVAGQGLPLANHGAHGARGQRIHREAGRLALESVLNGVVRAAGEPNPYRETGGALDAPAAGVPAND